MNPSSYTGPSHHDYVSKRFRKFQAEQEALAMAQRHPAMWSQQDEDSSSKKSKSRFSCFSRSSTTSKVPTYKAPRPATPTSVYSRASSNSSVRYVSSPVPASYTSSKRTSSLHSSVPSTAYDDFDEKALLSTTNSRAYTPQYAAQSFMATTTPIRLQPGSDRDYDAIREELQRRRQNVISSLSDNSRPSSISSSNSRNT